MPVTLKLTDQEAHMLITVLIAGRAGLRGAAKLKRSEGFYDIRSELAADFSEKLSSKILSNDLEPEKSYALSPS